MNADHTTLRRAFLGLVILGVPLGMMAAPGEAVPRPAAAQPPGTEASDPGPSRRDAGVTEGEQTAAADLAADQPEQADADSEDAQTETKPAAEEGPNLLNLLRRGGKLMWPIGLMSFLVVIFGLERFLGLRRRKVLPPELVAGLGRMAGQKGGLDPRHAYRLCQQYPSAAANVIKAMLLKVGRPHTEVEHTVSEANDREAARLYANVRWLSLAAGVSPLLGLLGTVWGMILAFFHTANLPTGANKAEFLADGIYVALVTTFAGLSVAIPAAVLAHFYEGWIQKLFRELDETLLGLMPQLERFEGRLRVSKDQMEPIAAESVAAARTPREASAAAQGPEQPAPAPK